MSMRILPVINCGSIACFRKRAHEAENILRSAQDDKRWVHVDIAKKPFTPKNTVICLRTMKKLSSHLRFEGHYMAPWSRRSFLAYLRAPFHRLYIHADTIGDTGELLWAAEQAKKYKKELGLVYVAGKSTYKKHPADVRNVLVLAVTPGDSGQAFKPSALPIVSFLKKTFPNVTITVDGGMEPKLIRKLAQLDVDAVTSGSYIWSRRDPRAAYKELRNVKLKPQNEK